METPGETRVESALQAEDRVQSNAIKTVDTIEIERERERGRIRERQNKTKGKRSKTV